jgi:hypothetical protein
VQTISEISPAICVQLTMSNLWPDELWAEILDCKGDFC